MDTEGLIVLLDAKTAKLDAKLKKTNDKLDELDSSTKKADSSFSKMGATSKVIAGSLVKLAAVGVAVSSAITAMTLSSANNRRELELLSKQAKTTTEDFQALSFATQTFGINAEQIADISKDIADKVGEFSAAGTGAFQDYADVMKLTKQEARDVAIEFEGLSSQEVIGKMVSEMESAGVTGDKMTFVLESMGNDLSKLIPLFSNNSAELSILKKRFDDVNDSLQITSFQADALKDVSDSYSLMTSQIGNATTSISASLAPALDSFFNDVIAVVPQATQTIIDFVNSFLDAENITSQAGVLKEIDASRVRILELQKEAKQVESVQFSELSKSYTVQQDKLRSIEKAIDSEKVRTQELNTQLNLINEQKLQLDSIPGQEGGPISAAGGNDGSLGTGDEIQAIADRFKSEEDLLGEKLDRELALIGDNKELRLQLEDEFLMNIVELDQAAQDEREAIEVDSITRIAELKEKAAKSEMALDKSVAKNAISLTKMILGDSKASALLGLVIQKAEALSANSVATLAGSQLAYASQLVPGDPTSVARAAAAASAVETKGSINAGLIIATGLGQAGAIVSGGGNNSTGGGSSPDQSQQQEFQTPVDTLQLTESTSTGSQAFNITVPDGDEIGEAIANWLNKAQIEGRV